MHSACGVQALLQLNVYAEQRTGNIQSCLLALALCGSRLRAAAPTHVHHVGLHMACSAGVTTLITHSRHPCRVTFAALGPSLVRQAVRHTNLQHRRQTVRPQCIKAGMQQQSAADREAPALPRAHQPKGQLNNALPKAKRRRLLDAEEEVRASEASLERVAASATDTELAAVGTTDRAGADELPDTPVTEPAALAAAAPEPGQASISVPGQQSASGTVVGAIALITGAPLVHKDALDWRCMPTACW